MRGSGTESAARSVLEWTSMGQSAIQKDGREFRVPQAWTSTNFAVQTEPFSLHRSMSRPTCPRQRKRSWLRFALSLLHAWTRGVRSLLSFLKCAASLREGHHNWKQPRNSKAAGLGRH
ncbi:hypothetical protein BT69DRAFT_886924 [Atractiella rhizophila]|nr:hypothetical protein BT69DRAFT_886924 [Atractiella rhizophila]